MRPNPLYRTLVQELEAVMPPRVVSRVLRDGLAAASASPESLVLAQVEALLKGAAFRQLQAHVPADRARVLVGEVLARLASVAAEDAPDVQATSAELPAPVAASVSATSVSPATATTVPGAPELEAVTRLRHALRPLNLYFDWPEVRKLRAQLHVIEDEARAGRDADDLVREAEAQLAMVHGKVEDHLVLQARDLADLEEALEAVAGLGGQRVRRLEALVATVRDAQEQRTVAEAEVERAQKLARALRKLVESSVLEEGELLPDLGRGDGRPTRRGDPARLGRGDTEAGATPTAGGDGAGDVVADAEAAVAALTEAGLAPEISERLRALDVDGERRALETLLDRHGEVLAYTAEQRSAVAALRAEHEAGRPAPEALGALRTALEVEAGARREAIRHEFEALRQELDTLASKVDVGEARRAVSVVLDVVGDALPPLDDVTAARELHAVASELAALTDRHAADATRRRDEALAQRDALVGRLEALLADAAPTGDETGDEALGAAGAEARAVRAALRRDEDPGPVLLERARDAEAALARFLAEGSDDHVARLRARARELAARVDRVPDLPALRARRGVLERELAALETSADLSTDHLRAAKSMVAQLVDDARAAVGRRLDELGRRVGDGAPDDLLRTLQDAARTLERGEFPDLSALDTAVLAAHDERRADLRRRYVRARQEARRVAAAGVPAAVDLEARVAAARSALDGDDDPGPAVMRLEAGIAEAEDEIAARLPAFEPRLDTALARFRRVARLNNDDVAAARRVLSHLDGQRAAVGRITPGLQAKLFEALEDAEKRLERLDAAYEATRDIADRLVAANLLDDVLDGFDALLGGPASAGRDAPRPGDDGRWGAGVTDEASGEGPERGSATTGDVAAPGSDLAAAWAPYLELEDVVGAVVLDAAGGVRAGRANPGCDLPALAAALAQAHASWTRLGRRLGEAAVPLTALDAGGPPTWVAPLGALGHAVVWTVGDAPAVGPRLRHDQARLEALLRTAPPTNDRGPD